jgi:DNA-binding NarL/FixJ family response regulator
MNLPPRQQQVLELVSHGLTDRQIADRLGIRPHTVRTHLDWLFANLVARNRAHAVAIGFEKGLLR